MPGQYPLRASAATALVLDGGGPSDELTRAAARAMVEALERAEVVHDTIVTRDIKIGPCTGCFGCWVRKPGECVFGGPSADIARMAMASDLLVIATPVTFGGYSYEIKKMLDRIACSMLLPFFTRIEDEFHHPARYPRLPNLVVMGTLPAPDAEATSVFETLVGRNARNLHGRRPAVAVAIRRSQ